jgi:hypothetical protein
MTHGLVVPRGHSRLEGLTCLIVFYDVCLPAGLSSLFLSIQSSEGQKASNSPPEPTSAMLSKQGCILLRAQAARTYHLEPKLLR